MLFFILFWLVMVVFVVSASSPFIAPKAVARKFLFFVYSIDNAAERYMLDDQFSEEVFNTIISIENEYRRIGIRNPNVDLTEVKQYQISANLYTVNLLLDGYVSVNGNQIPLNGSALSLKSKFGYWYVSDFNYEVGKKP